MNLTSFKFIRVYPFYLFDFAHCCVGGALILCVVAKIHAAVAAQADLWGLAWACWLSAAKSRMLTDPRL